MRSHAAAACLLLHILFLTPARTQPPSAPPYTRWTIATQDWVTASPVVGSDGSVYVGSWDCTMYCIGASGPTEGMVQWFFKVPGGSSDSPCAIQFTAAIDAAASTLYFTSALAGGLYAINMSTSLPLWVFNASVQQPSSGAPVISIGPASTTVYYGSNDSNVYAVSSFGQQLWKYTTSGNPGTPVLGTGSSPLLFVASGDSFLYALYTVGSSTGTLAWKVQVPSRQGFTATPVIGSNGVSPIVLAGNNDGRLYAFFQFHGGLAWNFSTFPAPDGTLQPITSTPLVTSSTVFFCGNDDYLYAITAASGQFLWRFPTGFGIGANPVLSRDGSTIYVGSIDGYIYAVYTTGSLAGQQQWKYYVGGGLTITGILSPAGDVIYGGNEVSPGSSVYAIQLPSSPTPSPPAAPAAPSALPSSDAAALRDMRIAFALLFLFTWLANVCGVCYYCRASSIAAWPEPMLTAIFLHFLCWIYLLRFHAGRSISASMKAPLFSPHE